MLTLVAKEGKMKVQEELVEIKIEKRFCAIVAVLRMPPNPDDPGKEKEIPPILIFRIIPFFRATLTRLKTGENFTGDSPTLDEALANALIGLLRLENA